MNNRKNLYKQSINIIYKNATYYKNNLYNIFSTMHCKVVSQAKYQAIPHHIKQTPHHIKQTGTPSY